jgi:hypothetical protein
MDLIFHIGLTKNASSFFQQKIAHGKMNTFERAIDWGEDSHQAKVFEDLFRHNSPAYWRSDVGIKFFENYKFTSGSSNVLISHESLYEHVPFRGFSNRECLKAEPFLLASRLGEISKHAWREGNVKVWFFFRRQYDWLPSIYSQVCYQLPHPSQSDFEKRVEEFLNSGASGSQVIDYSLLYEALAEKLGEENVLALPFEEFQSEETWKRIRDFTKIDSLGADINFKKNVNVRKKDDEENWLAHGKAQAYSKIFSLGSKLGFSKLPERYKGVIREGVIRLTRSQELRIYLPDYLHDKVTTKYELSNRRLSELIGKDLYKLGYW